MDNPVEPPSGLDPREGICRGQLARCNGRKRRGAIVALQAVEFPCRAWFCRKFFTEFASCMVMP